MSSVVARGEVSKPQRDGAAAAANRELSADDVWKESIEQLLGRLAATPVGLDTAEAQSRLATYGPNDAAIVKHSPLWLQFLVRFRNPAKAEIGLGIVYKSDTINFCVDQVLSNAGLTRLPTSRVTPPAAPTRAG